MQKIHLLPVEMQNRIAAGEVVERPASVVKELIENSADAASTQIRVDLTGAGKKMLSVTDNGAGMNPADARLAIERFTTSKLSADSEIFNINTFGFRGEALAAIASISKFSLVTSEKGADTGTLIQVSGGMLKQEKPAAPIGGTSIEVRDLFFNTPARRKFMKADSTELWHSLEAVTQRALASPNVAFTLKNNNRTVLDLPPAQDISQRLADLLGREFAEGLQHVDNHADPYVAVRGFVSLRDHHATRRQQYLFVNNRPIRSPALSQAIYRATEGYFPAGRHPVFIIFIDIPGEAVDVNVHPAKREVRFAQVDPIRQALDRALVPLKKQVIYGGTERVKTNTAQEDSQGFSRQFPSPTPRDPLQPFLAFNAGHQNYQDYQNKDSHTETVVHSAFTRPYISFGETFFAFSDGNGITLVDQHAAHERVLFEKILDRSFAPSTLLIPQKIELAAGEYEVLREHIDVLSGLGIVAEPFGGSTLLIRQVPLELKVCDVETVVKDIAGFLVEGRKVESDSLRKELAAIMACHDAVRSGDGLKSQDMDNLIKALDECKEPQLCPHGRPTRIHLTKKELLKMFKRT